MLLHPALPHPGPFQPAQELARAGRLLHHVNLLHPAPLARPAAAEKEAALRAFAEGRTPVLISTTVVEVGVDVPAASLMLVEHADRFGLAQVCCVWVCGAGMQGVRGPGAASQALAQVCLSIVHSPRVGWVWGQGRRTGGSAGARRSTPFCV